MKSIQKLALIRKVHTFSSIGILFPAQTLWLGLIVRASVPQPWLWEDHQSIISMLATCVHH